MNNHPGLLENWEIEPPDKPLAPLGASLVTGVGRKSDSEHIRVLLSRPVTAFEEQYVDAEVRAAKLGSFNISGTALTFYHSDADRIREGVEPLKEALRVGTAVAENRRQEIIEDRRVAAENEQARIAALRRKVDEIEF